MKTLLNFLVALRRLPPLSELTGDEERMLFELRELWLERGELTVADVYDLAGGKSASTAYRQLIVRIPTIARMYSDLMPRSVPI